MLYVGSLLYWISEQLLIYEIPIVLSLVRTWMGYRLGIQDVVGNKSFSNSHWHILLFKKIKLNQVINVQCLIILLEDFYSSEQGTPPKQLQGIPLNLSGRNTLYITPTPFLSQKLQTLWWHKLAVQHPLSSWILWLLFFNCM